MNLETLQQEVPCDAVWLDVVRAANLRPQQVQHISMALQTASQQQAELLQEQQAIMQQLQALLGASAAAAPAVTSSSVPQSFAAAAAAGDDDGGGGVVSAGCGIEAAGAATQAAAAAAAAAPTALSVAAAAEALPAYAAAPSIVGRTRAGVRKARAAAVDAAGGSSSTGYQQQVKLEPTAAADNPQTASKVSGSNPAADRGGSDACAAADSQASHAGCVIPAAAAAAAAGAVAASAAGSSGSSVGGMPGGVLAVEDAEQAERLLREWQRVCWSMKRTSRLLAPMVSLQEIIITNNNILSKTQNKGYNNTMKLFALIFHVAYGERARRWGGLQVSGQSHRIFSPMLCRQIYVVARLRALGV